MGRFAKRENMRLLLIQGANMEYLGRRQPELYGTTTAKELDGILRRQARSLGVDLDILYTNTEGEAVSAIFKADRAQVDGVLFNPAGFLHAGHALRDCLRSISAPAIEIHMTNIEKRGYGSITAQAAIGMIAGFGVDSMCWRCRRWWRGCPDRANARSPGWSAHSRRTSSRKAGRRAGASHARPGDASSAVRRRLPGGNGPVDRRRSLELQKIARREVDEQQRATRIAQQVAQRVEEPVAAEIGHDQRVTLHIDEPRTPAAVRDVETTALADVGTRATGDE